MISDRHVLTAAHCTSDNRNYDVIVGEHRITSTEDGTRHSVCRYADHPSYNSQTIDNDFSILHLDQPVQLGARAVPACLPLSNFRGDYLDGKTLTVSGWGDLGTGWFPEVLHSVDVPGMTNFQCNQLLTQPTSFPTSSTSFYDYEDNMITDNMLCAGQPSGGVDSCQGDSGGKDYHFMFVLFFKILITSRYLTINKIYLLLSLGPLTYTFEGQTFIVGVVSWGIGCALENKPGVYARVTEVLEWINREVKKSCSGKDIFNLITTENNFTS